MWGIVPAVGTGDRIWPSTFSQELLPGDRRLGRERPRAVSEYVVDRLLVAGADKLCFVLSPGRSELLERYGASVGGADCCYVVQPRPAGLWDALFRALPFVAPDEDVLVGLPDTVWFPEHALCALPRGLLSFLLFPVDHPEDFDAVVTDCDGVVTEILVKRPDPGTPWVWGAFGLPGDVLRDLRALWEEDGRRDEDVGALVNAWIGRGGRAVGVRAGEAYIDVGSLYRDRDSVRLVS